MQPKIEAYKNLDTDYLQFLVLKSVQDNPGITLKETAMRLGKKENTLSGRFFELEEAGVIAKNGKKKVGPSNCSKFYFVPEPEQAQARANYYADRFRRKTQSYVSEYRKELGGALCRRITQAMESQLSGI